MIKADKNLNNLYDKMMDIIEVLYREHWFLGVTYSEFYSFIRNEIIIAIKQKFAKNKNMDALSAIFMIVFFFWYKVF